MKVHRRNDGIYVDGKFKALPDCSIMSAERTARDLAQATEEWGVVAEFLRAEKEAGEHPAAGELLERRVLAAHAAYYGIPGITPTGSDYALWEKAIRAALAVQPESEQ